MSGLKVIKWILALAFAALLTIGTSAIILHGILKVDMDNLTGLSFWSTYLLFLPLVFTLFVILSCKFVSFRKRNAALLVILLSIVFIAIGIYHHSDDGYLANKYIIRYTGFIFGLTFGYVLSNKIFKNTNWI